MRRVSPPRRWLSLLVALSIAGCEDDTTVSPAPPKDRVTAGKSLVDRYDCASCHQAPDAGLLSGATTALPGTLAYAANLTPDPDTGLDSWSDQDYLAALRKGQSNDGTPLCPSMPRYTEISDDDGLAIAAYLRSLKPVHHDVAESVCPPVKPPTDAGSDTGG